MLPLLERLSNGEVLLSDGALGTVLLARGLEPGTCLESLNLTGPELLADIARAYHEAGSDIIHTNTFGASPARLATHGLQARTEAINRAAVLAVRDAVGRSVFVSASCGPTGLVLEPYGDAHPDDIAGNYHRQMSALIDAGADAICIETMTDLTEARLAIEAARDAAPDIPIMATMTFDLTPRGYFTAMGVSIEDAAHGLRDAGADVVGSNCGNGSERMVEIAGAFRRACDLPLLIQPNAGLPEMRDGALVYTETPEFMAEKIHTLLDLGVSIIGGCCGTTPDHLRAFRRVIDTRS